MFSLNLYVVHHVHSILNPRASTSYTVSISAIFLLSVSQLFFIIFDHCIFIFYFLFHSYFRVFANEPRSATMLEFSWYCIRREVQKKETPTRDSRSALLSFTLLTRICLTLNKSSHTYKYLAPRASMHMHL